MTTRDTTSSNGSPDAVDVVLVGGGIMSATLGTLIQQLEPTWSIRIIERLDDVALESSNPWNNAGTGHAALCELNYTPEKPDGTVDISKAVAINEQFHTSRELWHHLLATGRLADSSFVSSTPHMTFVRGAKNVDYLRRRYRALSATRCSATWSSPPTGPRSSGGPHCSPPSATRTSRSPPPGPPPAPTWTSATSRAS